MSEEQYVKKMLKYLENAFMLLSCVSSPVLMTWFSIYLL